MVYPLVPILVAPSRSRRRTIRSAPKRLLASFVSGARLTELQTLSPQELTHQIVRWRCGGALLGDELKVVQIDFYVISGILAVSTYL